MPRIKEKILKKFEIESNILKLFNLNQKIFISFLILFPLILSLITFLVSCYKTNFLVYLPFKNYRFYIAFFLYTNANFIVIYLVIRLILLNIKNKHYNQFQWSVLKTLILLWKNRKNKNINFFYSICLSIISFYSFFFYWLYYYNQQSYQDLSAIILIVLLTIFLSLNVTRFFKLIMGFQEGIIRYLPHFIILGTTIFFILLIALGNSDLRIFSEDPTKIISLIGVLFVPFITTVMGVWISKTFSSGKSIFAKERKIESFGWNKIFFYSFHTLFFSWFLFSLFFTYSIMKIAFLVFYTFEDYTSYSPILTIIVINLIFIVPVLILMLFTAGQYILISLNDWSHFFEIYYGKNFYQLDKTAKLIKTRGTVIGIKSSKTIDDPEVDYQFSISYSKNKIIEIVKLKENIPFLKSKNVVKEGDKVLVIGKIKKIYSVYPNANYHNVIFAYHVE